MLHKSLGFFKAVLILHVNLEVWAKVTRRPPSLPCFHWNMRVRARTHTALPRVGRALCGVAVRAHHIAPRRAQPNAARAASRPLPCAQTC